MESGKFKKVLIETIIPVGNYCWGKNGVCQHMIFGEGFPKCGLKHGFLHQDQYGYIKPKACKNMKEV